MTKVGNSLSALLGIISPLLTQAMLPAAGVLATTRSSASSAGVSVGTGVSPAGCASRAGLASPATNPVPARRRRHGFPFATRRGRFGRAGGITGACFSPAAPSPVFVSSVASAAASPAGNTTAPCTASRTPSRVVPSGDAIATAALSARRNASSGSCASWRGTIHRRIQSR